MHRCVILLILSLWLGPDVFGQSARPLMEYTLTDLADELPDVRVSGVVQDARGFMWIGTVNGLYRYDGVTYKPFKSAPSVQTRIGFNNISSLLLIFDHYLIIEGVRSVDVIDVNTEQLVYSSDPEQVFLQTVVGRDICLFHFEDHNLRTNLLQFTPDGQVQPWQGSSPGERRIDGMTINSHHDLYYFDRVGHLWYVQHDGSAPACIDTLTFHGRRTFYLPDLYCDIKDRVWILDYLVTKKKTLYRLGEDGSLVTVLKTEEPFMLLPTDTHGIFWWYNTDTRILSKWDMNLEVLTDLLELPRYVERIDAVYRDQQGIYWIGSIGTGIGLMAAYPHLQAFHKIRSVRGGEDRIGTPCRGVCELADGRVLIGCNDGVFQFDPQTTSLEPEEMLSSTGPINYLWDFAVDPGGERIWFTKQERGLFEYTIGIPQTQNYQVSGVHIGNRFLAITMDSHQVLWIGSQSGIVWFDTRLKTFQTDPEVAVRFYDVSSYRWVSTDDNTFWLCSSDGLYRFDSTRQIVAHYNINSDPALNTDEVFDLVEMDGRYWIATDNGLHVLSGDAVQVMTTADGLAHDAVVSIVSDGQAHLWLATFGGLSKLDVATGEFESYYVEDGLPHNEFNRSGKLLASDGTIYLSTQNGILYFNPSEVGHVTPQFPLVLTGFSAFGADGTLQSYPQEALGDLSLVTIPAGNKYFQVDFALLNFIQSSENRYTYYLEGLETDWHHLSRQSFAQYNNLPPGDYTLHIRAKSPTGYWSRNTLALRIHVLEHFYQRTGFYLAVIGLIVLLIILVMRYHYRQRLKLEQMRNRISSDLHDEVGGVLSGVAMQMDLLETRAPEDLRPFMQRVAESSRGAASKMRDVIWAIDSSKDRLQNLADRIKAYTQEILGPLEIAYKVEIHVLDPQQKLSVALRQNLYLIFKEALTNAMKHAHATSVRISLSGDRKHIVLVVEDNGVGFIQDTPSQGQGLRNMYTRAERIGGKLKIESSETGTRVSVDVSSSSLRTP